MGPASEFSFSPSLRLVSIKPGIDIAEPDHTDTRSGSCGAPKRLPADCSTRETWARTSSIRQPALLQMGRADLVVTTKPGGTGRPTLVISHRLAPLPPSSILLLPSPSLNA